MDIITFPNKSNEYVAIGKENDRYFIHIGYEEVSLTYKEMDELSKTISKFIREHY